MPENDKNIFQIEDNLIVTKVVPKVTHSLDVGNLSTVCGAILEVDEQPSQNKKVEIFDANIYIPSYKESVISDEDLNESLEKIETVKDLESSKSQNYNENF